MHFVQDSSQLHTYCISGGAPLPPKFFRLPDEPALDIPPPWGDYPATKLVCKCGMTCGFEVTNLYASRAWGWSSVIRN